MTFDQYEIWILRFFRKKSSLIETRWSDTENAISTPDAVNLDRVSYRWNSMWYFLPPNLTSFWYYILVGSRCLPEGRPLITWSVCLRNRVQITSLLLLFLLISYYIWICSLLVTRTIEMKKEKTMKLSSGDWFTIHQPPPPPLFFFGNFDLKM